MSIADYSELIMEVTDRSGVSEVANRASMFVSMAENALSKRLRTADQETVVQLTTNANGLVALPTDYAAMRSVRIGTKELRQIPYPATQDSWRTGYAIRGANLVSTQNETAHDCVYYATIPSLEANSTNWLLAAEPELYLSAVLFQVYTGVGNVDMAATMRAYVDQLVGELERADFSARHAGTKVDLSRIAP